MPSRNARERIRKAYDPGNWFMFPKCFLVAMSANEAILLSYLISHAGAVGAEDKRKGWFYCPMARIIAELFHNSEDRQTRTFKTLEAKGFIITRSKGLPAKRWIRIDYVTLQRIINECHEEWMENRKKRGLEE